jgi:hypothetical protein
MDMVAVRRATWIVTFAQWKSPLFKTREQNFISTSTKPVRCYDATLNQRAYIRLNSYAERGALISLSI